MLIWYLPGLLNTALHRHILKNYCSLYNMFVNTEALKYLEWFVLWSLSPFSVKSTLYADFSSNKDKSSFRSINLNDVTPILDIRVCQVQCDVYSHPYL